MQPNASPSGHRPREPRARRQNREYHPALETFLELRRQESASFVEGREARTRYVETHEIAYSDDTCSDGRVSDFPFAIGLDPGLLKSHRGPGSMESTFEDPVYMQRAVAHHELTKRGLDLVPGKRMAQIHLSMAHYSGMFTSSLGCGAWESRLDPYLQHMRALSAEYNAWKDGSIISIPGDIDTDTDGVRLYGADGRVISAAKFASPANDSSPERLLEIVSRIASELERVFLTHLEPLSLLDRRFREPFYLELAERIAANVGYIERARKSGRPPEALDHQERFIFIGRPLATRDRNKVFLIKPVAQ